MGISSQHITGFALGVGVSAVGVYLYRKNQAKVDEFLRNQGISVPSSGEKDYTHMSLKDLVLEKEHIEDKIAEREMEEKQKTEETAQDEEKTKSS